MCDKRHSLCIDLSEVEHFRFESCINFIDSIIKELDIFVYQQLLFRESTNVLIRYRNWQNLESSPDDVIRAINYYIKNRFNRSREVYVVVEEHSEIEYKFTFKKK